MDILFINRIKLYNKEIAKRLLLLNNTLLHSSNGMGGILHQYSDFLRIDDNENKYFNAFINYYDTKLNKISQSRFSGNSII